MAAVAKNGTFDSLTRAISDLTATNAKLTGSNAELSAAVKKLTNQLEAALKGPLTLAATVATGQIGATPERTVTHEDKKSVRDTAAKNAHGQRTTRTTSQRRPAGTL